MTEDFLWAFSKKCSVSLGKCPRAWLKPSQPSFRCLLSKWPAFFFLIIIIFPHSSLKPLFLREIRFTNQARGCFSFPANPRSTGVGAQDLGTAPGLPRTPPGRGISVPSRTGVAGSVLKNTAPHSDDGPTPKRGGSAPRKTPFFMAPLPHGGGNPAAVPEPSPKLFFFPFYIFFFSLNSKTKTKSPEASPAWN